MDKYKDIPKPLTPGSSKGGGAAVASDIPLPLNKRPAPESNYGPMEFITELLRNFNDSLTFGLWDKGLEATGIDPKASEKTANSNPWAKSIGRTTGMLLPGMGASQTLARTVPALAKPTLASVFGNNAVTSGGLSALEQLIKEGHIDPVQTAVDAGAGGVLGSAVHGVARVVSPKARVAAAGADMAPEDIAAARGVMDNADELGVSLSVPEAVHSATPAKSTRLSALYETAAKSPKGSQVVDSFNETRRPGIAQAGRRMVDVASPNRVTPFDVQMAANDAIDSVQGGYNATIAPLEEALATKKVAPNFVKKLESDHPYLSEAVDSVIGDAGKMKYMSDRAGVPEVPPNNVSFMDQVIRTLEAKAANAGGDTMKADIANNGAGDARAVLDRGLQGRYSALRNMQYEAARGVSELRSGPLGKLATTADVPTQGKALFGAADGITADVASDATRYLPNDVSRSVLAGHLDNAVTRNPHTFSDTALPNEHARRVASEVLPPNENRIIGNTLDAVGAVDHSRVSPHNEGTHFGPQGALWSHLWDYGKGDVAKLLQDKKSLGILGKVGPLQRLLARLAAAAEIEANSNEDPNGPLRITVRGGS